MKCSTQPNECLQSRLCLKGKSDDDLSPIPRYCVNRLRLWKAYLVVDTSTLTGRRSLACWLYLSCEIWRARAVFQLLSCWCSSMREITYLSNSFLAHAVKTVSPPSWTYRSFKKCGSCSLLANSVSSSHLEQPNGVNRGLKKRDNPLPSRSHSRTSISYKSAKLVGGWALLLAISQRQSGHCSLPLVLTRWLRHNWQNVWPQYCNTLGRWSSLLNVSRHNSQSIY